MRVVTCLTLIVVGSLVGGCASGGSSDFVRKVQSTPKIAVKNESTKPGGDVIAKDIDGGYVGDGKDRKRVIETKLSLTKHLESIVAFNPNASVLYAGSLIHGDSLKDGVLRRFDAERKKQECTITGLAGKAASKFSDTYIPSVANNTKFMNDTLTQDLPGEQPASASYFGGAYHSLEEGALRVNANYHWMTGSVGGAFSEQHVDAKTKLLIRFVQSYFTVTCAMPNDGFIGLFPWNANYKTMAASIQDNDPPAYIDSVTYGRELWMLIETNHSESEVKTALNFAMNALNSGGSVNFAAENKKVLDESTIQAFTLGGGGKAATSVIAGAGSVQAYLDAGANFSVKSPGGPISYTVRYLKDGDVARVSATSDYVIKTYINDPKASLVTQVTLKWDTTDNDKDWDTQPRFQLTNGNGQKVLYFDCCSSDRKGDHWSNNHSESRPVHLDGKKFTDLELTHGHIDFDAGHPRGGNDEWHYNAEAVIDFADGSQLKKSCTANSSNNHCDISW
ncbi:thiol-activated cytolysin family protein [Massilia sp. BJB1822]|uniref:thiol-activated cytolysin family protein n=1 Tax=Massilia sp. BJB1822 TaxID=2744470 RepID=UPI0015930F5D|nr:thiol-activated cytolysin family protein [Massilia sp. BJB1822]NVE01085.1 thiol-activated cytolysin family protein [Massilia sp. BJB1822]